MWKSAINKGDLNTRDKKQGMTNTKNRINKGHQKCRESKMWKTIGNPKDFHKICEIQKLQTK
jgi:hypothetical protein